MLRECSNIGHDTDYNNDDHEDDDALVLLINFACYPFIY